MDEIFELVKKIAMEEFGMEVIPGASSETAETLFGIDLKKLAEEYSDDVEENNISIPYIAYKIALVDNYTDTKTLIFGNELIAAA